MPKERATAISKKGMITVFLFVLDQRFIFVIMGSKCDFFFSCSLTFRGKYVKNIGNKIMVIKKAKKIPSAVKRANTFMGTTGEKVRDPKPAIVVTVVRAILEAHFL